MMRSRWQTTLVVLLIGIPVFAMTAATSILGTVLPTAEERATAEMGRADLVLFPMSTTTMQQVRDLVPADARVEGIGTRLDQVIAPGTRVTSNVLAADLDGLARGMLHVVTGRAPTVAGEVAVSADLARLAGVGIGDPVRLDALGPATVVGLVEDPRNIHRLVVLEPAVEDVGNRQWLIGLSDPASVDQVVASVAGALTPDVPAEQAFPLFDVGTRQRLGQASETFTTFVLLLGVLALVEAALVASAAFAVSIRRRQRELGLLGAIGATPRQLAASVLTEGLLCGGIAAVLGVALGVAVSVTAWPFLDDLAGRRVGPLVIDPGALVAAMAIGLGAALVAAGVPAWGVARMPTLVALSGRRPPSTPARRLLTLGLGLVGIALACTLGAPVLARITQSEMPILLLLVGSVAGVLGFGACSPWLLERMEGPARRLPLAARIAVRDTSRARTRNGPIVTAVLASVAGMIALAALLASQSAQQASFWQPSYPEDVLMVAGSDAQTAGPLIASDLGALGSGMVISVIDPGYPDPASIELPLSGPVPDGPASDSITSFVVGDEAMLRALGGASAIDAFQAGAIVVFPLAPVVPTTDATLTLAHADDVSAERPVHIAVVVRPNDADLGNVPDAVMSAGTAAALGLTVDPDPSSYLVRLDRPVTQADLDRAADLLPVGGQTYANASIRPVDQSSGFRMLLLVASLVVALSVTAVAVALGETETRADQRTLLALGAERGLRRRITAARGAVLALLAGILAVPAGLLPVWGVLYPRGWPIVVPLPEVIGALAILPLMAVAGGLLLGRPIPEWSGRRDQAG